MAIIATSSKVKQLPNKEALTRDYNRQLLQHIVDRHRLLIKAMQQDLVTSFEQLLDADEKVLLDKLLVAGTIDPTVPQQLEDIADLQTRVSVLEGFHP